ncbi:putative sterol carrier protein [Alkalihalobacillus xiaoxiensis]|uniref:Sterol carrier protein n=1 Tax=Shouchella xiaoxiensis TaxID=766895 RepID=A0ABS2T0E3_9BACI|nr:SCP2 sterol-binding domain-containing protein [Shouchella xiaoxiensis]MBM7841214.1 putative sterol carrier protein [Shouchella xiaoxiensis]
MTTREKLDALAEKMTNDPEKISGFNRKYQFELKPEARYGVQFSDGQVTVETDPAVNEDACTLKMSEANLHKLLEGDWNPTVAYMTGQLKIDGEVKHALKLHEIVKHYT